MTIARSLASLAILTLASTAFAQQTQTFDVSDLIVDRPDFSLADSGFNLGIQAERAEPEPQKPAEAESVFRQLFELITGESPTAKVAFKLGKVEVTAPVEELGQVAQALKSLRDARSIQVNVTSRMITLTPEQAKAISPEVAAFHRRSGMDATPLAFDGALVARFADNFKGVQAPRVTLFNQQRAYIVIATETAYISGYTVDAKAPQTQEPESKSGIVKTGMLMNVRVASDSPEAILLDFKLEQVSLLSLKNDVFTAPSGKQLPVQVPELRTQQASTLASLKPGQALLVPLRDSTAGERTFAVVTAERIVQKEVGGK